MDPTKLNLDARSPAAELRSEHFRAELRPCDPTRLNEHPALVAFVVFEGDEAEPLADGSVRYDGCVDVDLGGHFCGVERFEEVGKLLRQVYDRAGELMGGFA